MVSKHHRSTTERLAAAAYIADGHVSTGKNRDAWFIGQIAGFKGGDIVTPSNLHEWKNDKNHIMYESIFVSSLGHLLRRSTIV